MKEIGKIIEEIVKKNNLQQIFSLAQIKQIWQEEFAKTLTKNVKIVKLDDDSLILYTASSAWKKEILLHQKKIVEKINFNLETNPSSKNICKKISKIEI